VATCADNPSPADFDGVIIGSAIYTRRWLKTATRYLKRHAAQLDPHRTWLLHSGPCGEGARDEQAPTPRAVARVIGPAGLPAPVKFGGRLDAEHATGRLSRWMAAEGPLSGDFETGREFVPGRQTLPIRSIRRLQEGSSDGGGEIHRR
jgi:menaquinone-dependent protoporphyrinogen oxidase